MLRKGILTRGGEGGGTILRQRRRNDAFVFLEGGGEKILIRTASFKKGRCLSVWTLKEKKKRRRITI